MKTPICILLIFINISITTYCLWVLFKNKFAKKELIKKYDDYFDSLDDYHNYIKGIYYKYKGSKEWVIETLNNLLYELCRKTKSQKLSIEDINKINSLVNKFNQL